MSVMTEAVDVAVIDEICPVTTADVLRRAALAVPDNEAFVAGGTRRTFATLADDVGRARAALAASGVEAGDRVGLCGSNSYEWVVQFLAVTSRGAVAVPVNTRYRERDLEYCLRQSGTSFLFLEARVLTNDLLATLREILPEVDRALPGERLPELRSVIVLGADPAPPGTTSWGDFLRRGDTPVPATCAADTPALIQYTSGTTSRPKGVLLTHRAICGNGFVSGLRTGLRAGDRLHSARPFFHVAGTTQSILACLQHGTTLVTMPRFVGEDALRLIVEERCTHFSGNDTMAQMLLAEQRRTGATLHLRGAWLPASRATVAAVIDELGCHETVVPYGLSEAAPNVALSAWWEPEELRRTTSMLPQVGVEVQIRDATGAALPDDEVGEITTRGWNVMVGYWDDPAATAEALDEEGWLSTGDLGSMAEGRLTFRGRLKDIVRVGGENVAPAEVEDVVKSHPSVAQVCVVGVPDPRLVEVICAIVEPAAGADTAGIEDAVVAWCKDQIAGFKVPRHVVLVDSIESLSMTESSKVRRAPAREFAMRALGIES